MTTPHAAPPPATTAWLDTLAYAKKHGLTHRETRVLLAIAAAAKYTPNTPVTIPQTAIETVTGIDVAHIGGKHGAVATLTEKGWLQIVREGGGRNRPAIYRITTPPAIGGAK